MKADSLVQERYRIAEDAFVEIRIWRVPSRVRGSAHDYKYSLALISREECVLRYDNEAGKGDHRHFGAWQQAYHFTTPEQLIADFRRDVEQWRPS